jgi:hypothetical protein
MQIDPAAFHDNRSNTSNNDNESNHFTVSFLYSKAEKKTKELSKEYSFDQLH